MDETELDWAHLPAGVEVVSLWCGLHDAIIHQITSNRAERTLTIEIESGHIQKHHGLGDEYRFLWSFERVRSVRADNIRDWPERCPEIVLGLVGEERSQAISEWHEWSRRESVSWSEVETAFLDDDVIYDVYSVLVAADEDTVAVKVQGNLDGEYYELIIQAGSAVFIGSDGIEYNSLELDAMGEAYWDAFASRRKVIKGVAD